MSVCVQQSGEEATKETEPEQGCTTLCLDLLTKQHLHLSLELQSSNSHIKLL